MTIFIGLKFECRTRIGPIWALCPDSAHIGPILACLLGMPRACRDNIICVHVNRKMDQSTTATNKIIIIIISRPIPTF